MRTWISNLIIAWKNRTPYDAALNTPIFKEIEKGGEYRDRMKRESLKRSIQKTIELVGPYLDGPRDLSAVVSYCKKLGQWQSGTAISLDVLPMMIDAVKPHFNPSKDLLILFRFYISLDVIERLRYTNLDQDFIGLIKLYMPGFSIARDLRPLAQLAKLSNYSVRSDVVRDELRELMRTMGTKFRVDRDLPSLAHFSKYLSPLETSFDTNIYNYLLLVIKAFGSNFNPEKDLPALAKFCETASWYNLHPLSFIIEEIGSQFDFSKDLPALIEYYEHFLGKLEYCYYELIPTIRAINSHACGVDVKRDLPVISLAFMAILENKAFSVYEHRDLCRVISAALPEFIRNLGHNFIVSRDLLNAIRENFTESAKEYIRQNPYIDPSPPVNFV